MIEIPGYQMLRPLGSGGMATVYLARDIAADREVALKVMSPALLADSGFAARFLREARIAARLSHPHIVAIHNVGHVGNSHYLAMEYLAGGAVLDQHHTPRTLEFALRVVREIAGALGYVHGQGFVHRDVKTDNLLLREDGSAVLTDFGIVRTNPAAARITLAGTVIGTPQYMSPEQASAGDVDGRADLYALGIILYELLTGRVPYDANDSVALGLRHIDEPLPQLPGDVSIAQPLLDRLLAKQPAQRFQTGEQVVVAVGELERALAVSKATSRIDAVEPINAQAEPWLAPESRQQPELGTLEGLDDALAQRAPPRSLPRKRSQVSAVVQALIVLVLLAAVGAA
ncbi:MAG: serine/threonine-protein kinase, partial [Dokdonella sp.]